MTEAEAVQRVECRRRKLNIAPEMRFDSAERAIVEYKKNPRRPGPTEDRVAWVIRFSCASGSVGVYLDEADGEVLKITRTR
jgi:hypothetical protein